MLRMSNSRWSVVSGMRDCRGYECLLGLGAEVARPGSGGSRDAADANAWTPASITDWAITDSRAANRARLGRLGDIVAECSRSYGTSWLPKGRHSRTAAVTASLPRRYLATPSVSRQRHLQSRPPALEPRAAVPQPCGHIGKRVTGAKRRRVTVRLCSHRQSFWPTRRLSAGASPDDGCSRVRVLPSRPRELTGFGVREGIARLNPCVSKISNLSRQNALLARVPDELPERHLVVAWVQNAERCLHCLQAQQVCHSHEFVVKPRVS